MEFFETVFHGIVYFYVFSPLLIAVYFLTIGKKRKPSDGEIPLSVFFSEPLRLSFTGCSCFFLIKALKFTRHPFRYRGYVYDDETGLYYLQSRYYDPKTGRFLNADIYFDTASGSSLSTNMFAYCENCSTLKIDINGKDAWWIESPNSVPFGSVKNGHTSILIQEKPGFWWYFYWGDKSIQLLFLGTVALHEINKRVRAIINYWNGHCRKSKFKILRYDEEYRERIWFHGNFSICYNRIKQQMISMRHNVKIGVQTYYNATVDNLTFFTYPNKGRYKYNGHTYNYPSSMILYGNTQYDTFNNNCMQVCTNYLYLGKLNRNDKSFKNKLLYVRLCIQPNLATQIMKWSNFGDWRSIDF